MSMNMNSRGYFICDIDGVLLDIITPMCKIINKDYGTNLTPQDITTWDWEYCLGFPASYWHELWPKLWHTSAKPYPMAHHFIQSLHDLGLTPIGLSARPWGLARNAANRDNAILDLDIIYVDSNEAKAPKINYLWPNAQFALEDNTKNARDFMRHCPGITHSLLLDRPWNQRCRSVLDTWNRVYEYTDIINQLTDLFTLPEYPYHGTQKAPLP